MRERDMLVIKILCLGYLVHVRTSYCVFLDFSGHIDRASVSIRESVEFWQREVLETDFATAYKDSLREVGGGDLADLRSKVEVLERILNDREIPCDELEYVEEYVRSYLF